MSFITGLISNVKELAKPNRYKIYIGPVASIEVADTRAIEMNCSAITWPGTNIATTDERLHGAMHKMPYDRIYNPVNATFYNTVDHKERTFFEHWLSSINTGHSTRFDYYDNYTTVINIMQLDSKNMVTKHIKLFDAYPMTIGDIELSYASENVIEQFTTTFTYHRYQIIPLKDTVFKNVLDFIGF